MVTAARIQMFRDIASGNTYHDGESATPKAFGVPSND